ncbi:hypothetical protein BC1002_5889 [Paraburkholderia atlantica]|uniref:Uncharacterized protein n=1 Tax=Paraburkholderia atlantica TaxID=2654982 RepID=D5WKM4_PARAM|nr:hypothetical protein BC1002_5889 [Paraburkholderia atlantica]
MKAEVLFAVLLLGTIDCAAEPGYYNTCAAYPAYPCEFYGGCPSRGQPCVFLGGGVRRFHDFDHDDGFRHRLHGRSTQFEQGGSHSGGHGGRN